ncbi:putative dUTPase [Alphaentomopoxvirus acuprea]|uniref:dUTP diphosphatase n=1 Tax=Alphaentomopoxvirus acuprea TaxID=62099 RepID=W6JIL1_9POXV|nr:putative dUTPase [Anomala cuprea entomopoxvirus]BAO49408.1 putative dUTPase [Anomala cuprea entomopoxvirus]
MNNFKNKYYLYGWLSSSMIYNEYIYLDIKNISLNVILNIKNTINNEFKSIDINDHYIKIPAYEYKYINSIPDFVDDKYKWQFIQGIFDNIGDITTIENTGDITTIVICISTESYKLKKFILDESNLDGKLDDLSLTYIGINAIDFLYKIYKNKLDTLANHNKYKEYANLFIFKTIPSCKFMKTRDDAINPIKFECSDEAYDLFIIDIYSVISDSTCIYDTGIILEPDFGWHIEIYARSSLIKYGYIISNGIGLIDSSYRGTIKVSLTKLFDTDKKLSFPFRAIQAVLKPNVHYEMKETINISKTTRNEKGFGSTNI